MEFEIFDDSLCGRIFMINGDSMDDETPPQTHRITQVYKLAEEVRTDTEITWDKWYVEKYGILLTPKDNPEYFL